MGDLIINGPEDNEIQITNWLLNKLLNEVLNCKIKISWLFNDFSNFYFKKVSYYFV